MHNNLENLCPVCGYSELQERPYDDGNNPSYEICPSCGTEFGYDDASKEYSQLRDSWIKAGYKWWSSSIPKPENWNPKKQLLNLKHP